jgi:hypothetical protein
MKQNNFFKNSSLAFASILFASLPMFGQTNVVVPNDLIQSDYANSTSAGWRLVSVGNSQASLVAVADFSIPANFGPHSVRSIRPGGPGLNRSFLGYFESGHTLASLNRFSWNRYSEPSAGTDSYLNIFIRNGNQVATVVYVPTVIVGSWNEFTFNSSVPSSQLILRYNGNVLNISYNDLITNFGSWEIYNHANTLAANFAGDFLGGIVIVSGSSSPSLAQTHTYDGVTVSFHGAESKFFDFVNETVQPPVGCTASEVLNYSPTKRNDGSDLPATRKLSSNALGAPQNNDNNLPEDQLNFVALGFGGSITLKLSCPIKNEPGQNDLKIVETSFGNSSGNCIRYPETVQVYVSQDGCNWINAGKGCQDLSVDFGPLNWAQYVKLVDISPIDGVYNNQVADGYDVDGVISLSPEELNPVTQDFGSLHVVAYSDFTQGTQKNGGPVAQARSNPNQSLGAPQNNNTVNFVSLGFGGSIILKLGYVVFDKPGNDLQIVETSFGNPSCNNYPEKAQIEVSLDKSTWFNLGVFCGDISLDFSSQGATAVQYIRFSDRSPRSRFSGGADGYDIDGIVVLHPGCADSNSPTRFEDNTTTPDEVISYSISPNPFTGSVALEVMAAEEANQINVRVMNISGQVVFTSNVNVAANSSILHTMDMSALSQGIYFVSVESTNSTEVFKLVKQ